MNITDKMISEYTELHRKHYNEELTKGEVTELLTGWFTLYQLVCRPLPNQDKNRLGGA